jgi:hypothetical protein
MVMKQKYLLLTIILFVFLFLFSTPSLALIPGDFGSADNGPPDGVVDFEDLMIFALAYGSTPSVILPVKEEFSSQMGLLILKT